MARTPQFDPGSSEARSSWLAGLTEACNKISGVLDMKTETFYDLPMPELHITEKDRYRIYQVPIGNMLWLQTPAPVIKKNGIAITPETDGFSIDYLGGSIVFDEEYKLTENDVITVSATHIADSSNRITSLVTGLAEVSQTATKYKGSFDTVEDLQTGLEQGQKGDYVLVDSEKSFYIWDEATGEWTSTQALTDLSNYYDKEAIDELLKEKQDNIPQHGETNASDAYYYGGRRTWQNVYEKVLGTILTDLDISTDEKIAATDTVLSAFGKLQAQIDSKMHDLSGSGAPTEATEGRLGQDYISISTGAKYHLVAIETQADGTTKYIWEQYANASDTSPDAVTTAGGGVFVIDESTGLTNGPITFEVTEEGAGDGVGNIDDVPTAGSQNAISSGAVAAALSDVVRGIPVFQIVLASNGWANKAQTISDSRFLTDNKYVYRVEPDAASYSAWVDGGVRGASIANGSITFAADTVPTSNLTINILRLQIGE